MDQNKKSYLALLKKQKKERNWDAMLVTAQEAAAKYPDTKALWRQLHYAQVHYVDAKLESDLVHQLEDQHDFDALLKVYFRLLSVFPDSKKLKKLISKTKKEKSEMIMESQKHELAAAQKRIKLLTKEGRLEEALNAAFELLLYAPENKSYLRLKDKLLRKREKSINHELNAFFDKSVSLVRDQYKADKKSVVRI